MSMCFRTTSIQPALGVVPPSNKLSHSSTLLAPPRCEAIADSIESIHTSRLARSINFSISQFTFYRILANNIENYLMCAHTLRLYFLLLTKIPSKMRHSTYIKNPINRLPIKRTYLFLLIVLSSSCAPQEPSGDATKDLQLTTYVDPYIGTDFHGHVFLGANVPFG